VLGVGAANAQSPIVNNEMAKLLASDGAHSDYFGYSVAIDGNLAIIGAPGDDDNGSNSGSAYIFDFASCEGDLNGDGNVGVVDLLVTIDQWGPCSNCDADVNGDGEVNVLDLLVIIDQWGECQDAPLGACVLPSQTCTVVEESECNSLGGLGWLAKGSCSDIDGDRIPDDFELNDCSFQSGAFSGSDPLVADTDEDGIEDGDEVFGTLAGLDLQAFGCNPCRKDILVETDWVYANGASVDRNKLHGNQVYRIVEAFANAPVTNVDGTTGITMHIDYGQAPYNGGNSVADPNGNSSIDFDTWEFNGEFPIIKTNNFNSNRHGYFHYCVLADAYSVGGVQTGSSGLGELPGDDFVTTMGAWSIGDDDRIGNTFVHELGHNLNIRHGGFENRNWKPNYNSVMNYRHQFCGVDTNGDSYSDFVLDYSRGTNIQLNENSLNETVGVTGFGPAIDWDEDGNANETSVSRNINCELETWYCGPWSMLTRTCGSGTDCYDSTCNVASDHNDWANVYYHGIDDDNLLSREIIHCLFDRAKIVIKSSSSASEK
jgi:hypothetical protein